MAGLTPIGIPLTCLKISSPTMRKALSMRKFTRFLARDISLACKKLTIHKMYAKFLERNIVTIKTQSLVACGWKTGFAAGIIISESIMVSARILWFRCTVLALKVVLAGALQGGAGRA